MPKRNTEITSMYSTVASHIVFKEKIEAYIYPDG